MSDLPVVLVFAPQALELQSPPGLAHEARGLDCRWYASDDGLPAIIARERPDIIASFGVRDAYPHLAAAPFGVRRLWLHFDVATPGPADLDRAGAMVYCYYLRRLFTPPAVTTPLVSVFTPTYRPGERIVRAYQSLVAQSWDHWEWVVVDDSHDDDATWRELRVLTADDPRVSLHRSDRPSGRIGDVKRRACALSSGDILVELDHDDELTPDALAAIVTAFRDRPDAGFAYSDWAEVIEGTGTSLTYGDGWAFGHGRYRTETYRGQALQVACAPPINGATIRHIVSAPNHVRAWRREAYWRAGGHNALLHVADDYELMVRTFLHTQMVHIPALLYVQHLNSGSNTQDQRRGEIQRLVRHIRDQYEQAIHQRLVELGLPDPVWRNPAPIAARSRASSPARGDLGDLSVIVLDATATSLTVECLESVRRFCPGAEIVLVGNGVDSQARHLAETYIALEGNIGVAAGWNLAVLRATRPYLCFLNDDAVFVDGETPRWLLAAARGGAIAGPYSNRAKPPQGDIARERTPADDQIVPAIVGVCLVVSRETFDTVGGFDARLLTWDDDDFCRRAARHGAASLVVGGTWVAHHRHASFRALGLDLDAIARRAERRFAQTHAPIHVAAIACDEQEAMAGFIDQFRAAAGEVVIVDTGSTDGTIVTAERAGARVVRGSAVEADGFAAARNSATAQAAGESGDGWILMLDPDERLDRETIAAIPELLASAGDRFDAFLAPLVAVSADQSRRAFVPKPFLYRAGACQWRYLVHEKLIGGRHAMVMNATIEHQLPLHAPQRRRQAEQLYARLAAREPYFTDAAFRAAERRAWPILDYERLDDTRIEKVHAGPLVSVVIPTFNRPDLCVRAVRSALAQDWITLEVIVVGDACPRVEEVRAAVGDDPRVRCINLAVNHGAGGAVPRNVGVAAAAGTWIAYLDDDNAWDRDHVSSVMAAIRTRGATWGFSSMRVLGGVDLRFVAPARGQVDTSCLIHARRVMHDVGPWRSRAAAGDYAHDWDFVSRLLDRGEPWAATARPTVDYNAESSGQLAYLRQRADELR